MNIAYFRKSNFSLEETITNVVEIAQHQGWKVLGEANLPQESGKMVLICRPEWVKTIIDEDYNLLGFLPCAISVFKKDDRILIGTGQPAVIKAITRSQDIAKVASQAEIQIKALIHQAAGVGELKPSRVKLYSTMSCPYCKMEKSWLEKHHVKHEQIYVDLNPKAAEEMVARTSQMGVPVTEIEYEEGDPEYIIGFDQARLTEILQVN